MCDFIIATLTDETQLICNLITGTATPASAASSQASGSVSTSHAPTGVSTSHPPAPVSTGAGVSTSHPPAGVSTSQPPAGVSTSAPQPPDARPTKRRLQPRPLTAKRARVQVCPLVDFHNWLALVA